MTYHEPVLLKEVLSYLNVVPNGKYIDCTLGDGGHTIEILKQGGSVLGLDYSQSSLDRATKRITEAHLQQNFIPVLANFSEIETVAQKHNFTQVDGILFDLGYSSVQLDEDALGLSFKVDNPLDMRIDKNLGVTAADLVNTLSQKQLEQMLFEYGEERLGKKFAEAIVGYRKMKPLQTTKELSDLIVGVAPSGYDNRRIHPATRTFQALRIVVNDEISNLKIALPRAARLLKLPGGRMLVISFHSLEDRVTKQFGHNVRPNEDIGCGLKVLTKKPVVPSEAEIKRNNRSRSAKLRVFETK